MPVPVSSADVSSPRSGDAHSGRGGGDREIVASIPIKVPLPTLPHSTDRHASDPEATSLVPPTPDAELLAAFVRHRDPEAFTQIVQRYSQMVYRVAMRTVIDRHLADDVFQATFLVLSQSARKIKSGEVLAAWLHGTARNLARRALTHKHTQRQHLAQVAILTRAEKGGEMTTSTEIDPLDELVRRHEQQLLDEELQQLPEASRAPLVLYYLEEKSQAEIAQLMGLSVEAVEGRLRRAKQELRLRLIQRGVTLSTVIAAANLLVPSIAFAAPSSTLVSATLISALGGTAASTLLTTGATTAAKLAAQEVAAMSVAGKTSAFILATTVSTTLAVVLGFSAFVNSMAGGGPPVVQVAGKSLVGHEEGALTLEGFASEIPEPVLLAQAEADEPAENAEPSPDPVDPEADQIKAVVYQIGDLNEEQRKAAIEFAETLSDSVTRHEKTNSLVIRATAENHRRLAEYLSNQRVKLNGEEREKLVIQQEGEILKWQQSYRAEQVEKEQVRDEMARLLKEHNDRIRRLNEVVDHQRKQLEDLQNLSFDVPDGKVTAVDASNETVWLNIGRTDGLRAQVTFSVYGKATTNIAHGPQNVKAKIEVVEVNETSSVSRIVEADLDHPIEIGDLIFSPAWTEGVREYFALVGDGDLDSDGESDAQDRKILKDLLVNANAEIDIEITHEGLRVPLEGQLTAQTKWLIVGDLGDPTNAAAMGRPPAEIQRILTVQSQHEMLVQEAVERGIRVVSMKDFLTYLGWKPEGRVLIPGANAPFQLKPRPRNLIPDPSASPAANLTVDPNLDQIGLQLLIFEADEAAIAKVTTKANPKSATLELVTGFEEKSSDFFLEHQATILSRPTMYTLMGQPGQIQIGHVVPVTGDEHASELLTSQPAGVTVQLTPRKRTHEGGLILEYQVEISDRDAASEVDVEGISVPTIVGRTLRGFTIIPTIHNEGILLGPIWTTEKTNEVDPPENPPTYIWIQNLHIPNAATVPLALPNELIQFHTVLFEVEEDLIDQLAVKFGSQRVPKPDFQDQLESLKASGKLKCLAEPTLVTTTGKPIMLRSGGEFPIPPLDSNTDSLRFQEFGIKLDLMPHPRGSDGRMLLEYHLDVSERNANLSTEIEGTEVPGVTGRTIRGFTRLAKDGKTGNLIGPILTTANSVKAQPAKNVETYLWICEDSRPLKATDKRSLSTTLKPNNPTQPDSVAEGFEISGLDPSATPYDIAEALQVAVATSTAAPATVEQIQAVFQKFLERPPTQRELDSWLHAGQLQRRSLRDIQMVILAGNAVFNRVDRDKQKFIELLFQLNLDRAPTSDEQRHWVSRYDQLGGIRTELIGELFLAFEKENAASGNAQP